MSVLRRRADDGLSRISVLAALVAVVLTTGVVALLVVASGKNTSTAPAGARIAAASSSSPAPSTSAMPRPAPTLRPVTPRPSSSVAAVATTRPPAARKPITYVVRKGDNLTVIAAWFHQHGYGALYEWNRAVIGDNPNLIYPGQRITVSGTGMTVSR